MVRAPEELDLLKSKNPDLAEVSRVMNRNYIRYHLTKQQLHDLQDWISKQKVLKD